MLSNSQSLTAGGNTSGRGDRSQAAAIFNAKALYLTQSADTHIKETASPRECRIRRSTSVTRGGRDRIKKGQFPVGRYRIARNRARTRVDRIGESPVLCQNHPTDSCLSICQ